MYPISACDLMYNVLTSVYYGIYDTKHITTLVWIPPIHRASPFTERPIIVVMKHYFNRFVIKNFKYS